MTDIESLNGLSTGTGSQSVSGVESVPETTGNGELSPLVTGNANLTISVFEKTEERSGSPESEGVESPSAAATESEVVEETDSDSDNGGESDEGDSGDSDEGEAAEDIALSASTVFTNALLLAAEASSLSLDPVQSVLNRFKQTDSAEESGDPASSGLLTGELTTDFDSEANGWHTPADGLTESFAASMARFNQGGAASGQQASLGELLGYELIEA